MKRIVIALAAAVVLAVCAVTAWNVLDNESVAETDGRGMVPSAEVARLAQQNFARPWEDAPESVSCPRGLRPAKFDHVTCQAVFGGERKPMIISVTGVHGDRVSFDYGVVEKDRP
ncbi:DUF4333 domain-containing protein [Streptomyces sp. ODS28]|uniref:DUF4333 domain-containing protein n=1 Tax=Streptomyces sp. ODS28 TaxID=3136688 RepID=UPI0031EB4DE2